MIFKLTNAELFEGFTLKGIKTFIGREGDGFNATLYFKGKKVAFAYDDASGGEVRIDWVDKSVQTMLDERLQKAGNYSDMDENDPSKKYTFKWDNQFFINDLVNHYLSIKDTKKLCKTKTVATLIENGKEGTYQWNMLYTPAVDMQLRGQYKDKLVCIWNKELEQYI